MDLLPKIVDYEPPPEDNVSSEEEEVMEEKVIPERNIVFEVPEPVEEKEEKEEEVKQYHYSNNIDEEVNEETGEKNQNFVYEEPVKPKKKKQTRKPLSEEHKEKLRLGRLKSLEVRKKKKDEKIYIKDMEMENKKLELKTKREKAQFIKKENENEWNKVKSLIEKKPTPCTPAPPPTPVNQFTKKDLEEATLHAVSQYDTLRKQRKKEKLALKEEELKKKNIRDTISRATGHMPTYGQQGFFDNCF